MIRITTISSMSVKADRDAIANFGFRISDSFLQSAIRIPQSTILSTLDSRPGFSWLRALQRAFGKIDKCIGGFAGKWTVRIQQIVCRNVIRRHRGRRHPCEIPVISRHPKNRQRQRAESETYRGWRTAPAARLLDSAAFLMAYTGSALVPDKGVAAGGSYVAKYVGPARRAPDAATYRNTSTVAPTSSARIARS